VASVREVSRFDVVLEVDSPGYTLVNACAAALYNRMLTTPEDLCSRVGHILVLRPSASAGDGAAETTPINATTARAVSVGIIMDGN
jgi:hypothetical protein